MSVIKLIIIALTVLAITYLAGLSFLSRQHRIKAEGDRQLSPCPGKPNCVSSLSVGEGHAVSAFSLINEDPVFSWDKLMVSIQKSGGEMLVNDGRYAHAIFTSRLFRFKDDLEVRLEEKQIDVRSASRAGTSDLGQNRKRVEQIRLHYSVE